MTDTTSTPTLQLSTVTKEYRGSPPVKALDSVSLQVKQRELLAITGPSGSGKSTLLNVIGTLDRPSAGEVVITGTAVAGLSDRQVAGLRASRIGFVFQTSHLLETASAAENVAAGLLYQGVARAERRSRALAALQRVGLGHRVDHRSGLLSGGERQRIVIARAIVGEPAIVLADEPTGNLDSGNSQQIMSLLTELNRDGSTIIVVTHDREIAAAMPRRVEMRDGRIVADR